MFTSYSSFRLNLFRPLPLRAHFSKVLFVIETPIQQPPECQESYSSIRDKGTMIPILKISSGQTNASVIPSTSSPK